jgi:IMP dehydrogenase
MLEDNIKIGLTFDDVLLVPVSIFFPELLMGTWLASNIKINVPIVSAAMDTVTEAKLAITQQEGGTGIIHRAMPVNSQATEVTR